VASAKTCRIIAAVCRSQVEVPNRQLVHKPTWYVRTAFPGCAQSEAYRKKEACFCAFGGATKIDSWVPSNSTYRGPGYKTRGEWVMLLKSIHGDGSGGSMASAGSSSVLGRCNYARCAFTHMRIEDTTASFFCGKSYLKTIGLVSAEPGRRFSYSQASNHRERGL